MKQFRKQKKDLNGILNASVRTKMPSSDKVMPHAQMHRLLALIFTHLRFMNSVASDQHNYVNNIKMIKGVHQLTLRTNILISLIDHFTMFNGCMNSQADPCAKLGFFYFIYFFFLGGWGGVGWVSGPTARIQDPHMGPIQYVRTHAQTGS